jgi:hypothetical protein
MPGFNEFHISRLRNDSPSPLFEFKSVVFRARITLARITTPASIKRCERKLLRLYSTVGSIKDLSLSRLEIQVARPVWSFSNPLPRLIVGPRGVYDVKTNEEADSQLLNCLFLVNFQPIRCESSFDCRSVANGPLRYTLHPSQNP